MTHKVNIKSLICFQKVAARKSIAANNIKISKTNSSDQYDLFRVVADEKEFLSNDFGDIKDINGLMNIVHNIRHRSITKVNNYIKCKFCKEIIAEMVGESQTTMAPDVEEDLRPRIGNLLDVLEKDVASEVTDMEKKRIPSQNDLTRWALKESVLRWYKDKNLPYDMVVVDELYDDRLVTQLAPDFDVIYKMWVEKLDELRRRNDKYALTDFEFDKAEEDMLNGMRGSAFEKQLDRYREDFMQKLKR